MSASKCKIVENIARFTNYCLFINFVYNFKKC